MVFFCALPKVGDSENARVAELVDALDSGSSGGNPVQVRVLSRAPYHSELVLCGISP